ncbi:MAG: methyltransferase domain-containing protein [Nitrospirae bacterium]|nr:methyltransferase domain-containing protein [Nitrospirota bacterium]
MILHKDRDCPVCGSKRKDIIFHQDFTNVSGGTLLTGYDVVICLGCGFGYADGLPEQAEFDSYYEQMSKYEYEYLDGEQSDFDARRFPVAADFIRSLLPDLQARVLDIGCSNGGLLHALQRTGYTNIMGLDPSPVCVRNVERLYGIPVTAGTLSHLPPELGLFDCVFLGAVLEHVRELKTALGQTRSLLKPGGLLYVEVPDITRFTCSPDAPFQEFSIEHINYFSVVSLKNLLISEGFDMIRSSQTTTMLGNNIISPELKAMFRMVDIPSCPTITQDTETKRILTEYIGNSRGVETRIHMAIAPWVENRKPIIVWGVGTHTQRLLATSGLAQASIQAFVDSNPRYQGKLIYGLPILPPLALKERGEPILISSRFFQKEIEHQIRDELGLGNELILLYDV